MQIQDFGRAGKQPGHTWQKGTSNWSAGTGSFCVRPAAEQGGTEMGTTQVIHTPAVHRAHSVGCTQREGSCSLDIEECVSSTGVPTLFNVVRGGLHLTDLPRTADSKADASLGCWISMQVCNVCTAPAQNAA